MQTATNWQTHTETLAARTLETPIGAEATIPTLSPILKCVAPVMVDAPVMTAMILAIVETGLALELLMNQPFRLFSKLWRTLMLQRMTCLQATHMP